MLVSVVGLKCSNCGESLSESMATCPSCDQPVVIRKVSSLLGLTMPELRARSQLMDIESLRDCGDPLSVDADFTSGCCLLRLKMFEQAIARFDKAVAADPCNADALFCAAIAALKGRRPFLVPLADIRKAQECLVAAAMVEDRAVFHYLLAYIKQDFYARRFLRIEPDWRQELQTALTFGITNDEKEELFKLVGQSCPSGLALCLSDGEMA